MITWLFCIRNVSFFYAYTCCHCWQISFHRSHIDKAFLQYEYWCVLEMPAWSQILCYISCIGKVLRDLQYEILSYGSSFWSSEQVFRKKCKVTFHAPSEYVCSDRIATWFGMGNCDISKMVDLQACISCFQGEFSNAFHY